jgi:DNA-binding transcriptional regulator YbjK
VIVSRISDPFRSALLDALLNEIQRQGFQALRWRFSPWARKLT